MASVQEVLFARMQAVSALTSLVGTRCYYGPVAAKNPTLPYINFFRISESRESAMGADIGIVRARFQFSVFAAGADAVDAVAKALDGDGAGSALRRWQPGTSVTPSVQDVFFLTRQDLYEDDTKLHHAAIDYEVIHGE